MENAMAAPDWQSELADIILQLWMEDVTAWVTVDQVRPEMGQHGHDLSREQLADAMGVVAVENVWQIEMTSDDLVQFSQSRNLRAGESN
jgi:hypothetical protein